MVITYNIMMNVIQNLPDKGTKVVYKRVYSFLGKRERQLLAKKTHCKANLETKNVILMYITTNNLGM